MNVKKSLFKPKKQKSEEKVEDIYGVHFKYHDLFTRLLQVQKQRKLSEEKSPVPRIPSFDSIHIKQTSTFKVKKDACLSKKSSSNTNLNPTTYNRSVSVRKILPRQPATDRKLDIIKSHSPNQKKTKKLSQGSRPVKKAEKKNNYTLRILKKY